jgi:hypothetical protein
MLVLEVALPGPSPLSATRAVTVQPLSEVGSDTVKTRKRKLSTIQALPGILMSWSIWFLLESIISLLQCCLVLCLNSHRLRCTQHKMNCPPLPSRGNNVKFLWKSSWNYRVIGCFNVIMCSGRSFSFHRACGDWCNWREVWAWLSY